MKEHKKLSKALQIICAVLVTILVIGIIIFSCVLSFIEAEDLFLSVLIGFLVFLAIFAIVIPVLVIVYWVLNRDV